MKKLLKAMSLLIVVVLLTNNCAWCQDDSGSLYNKILHFPDRLFKKVDDKTSAINERLMRQTDKYLERLSRQESKLQKKLAKKDSLAAVRIFGDAKKQYAALSNSINSTTTKAKAMTGKYIPHLDTLKTAFAFLSKTEGLAKNATGAKTKLDGAIGKMDLLQDKFNKAEEVNQYLRQRRQYLQEQLTKYGMAKDLLKLKKQVYYYQAQVEEYKRMFDEPSKLEAKAIEVLKQTAIFRNFFGKHSELAGMFRLPGSSSMGGSTLAGMEGLQTREMIQQDLVQRFGSGPNVQQMMKEQVQGARNELSQLKEKLNGLKSGSKGNGDPSMPDFKPNNQKTKSFKSRLEVGSNLQTVKSTRFFPSTSDIGLSLGYKLNDKSIIGIGSSYKMGWGKDIRNIAISHQGIGIRSFMDYKIKGSFWLSGGGEMNYRSQFRDFEILDDYSAWQKSALVGLSKKYKVSKKIKGNAQVMYDMLWRAQVPRTQPVIFRVGYNF